MPQARFFFFYAEQPLVNAGVEDWRRSRCGAAVRVVDDAIARHQRR